MRESVPALDAPDDLLRLEVSEDALRKFFEAVRRALKKRLAAAAEHNPPLEKEIADVRRMLKDRCEHLSSGTVLPALHGCMEPKDVVDVVRKALLSLLIKNNVCPADEAESTAVRLLLHARLHETFGNETYQELLPLLDRMICDIFLAGRNPAKRLDDMCAIEEELVEEHGKSQKSSALPLFLLTNGDALVSRLIILASGKNGGKTVNLEKPAINFFDQMREFLLFYGRACDHPDFRTLLLPTTKHADPHPRGPWHAGHVQFLHHLFRDSRLQTVDWHQGRGGSLSGLAEEMLSDPLVNNPWVLREWTDTPFGHRNTRGLLRENDPAMCGKVFARINEHAGYETMRKKAKKLVDRYDAGEDKSVIRTETLSLLANEYRKNGGNGGSVPSPDADTVTLIAWLRRWLDKPWTFDRDDDGPTPLSHVALRMLDMRKIAVEPHAQDAFGRLYADVQHRPKEDRRTASLEASLKQLLQQDEPLAHLPLNDIEKKNDDVYGRSLQELLIRLHTKTFPPDSESTDGGWLDIVPIRNAEEAFGMSRQTLVRSLCAARYWNLSSLRLEPQAVKMEQERKRQLREKVRESDDTYTRAKKWFDEEFARTMKAKPEDAIFLYSSARAAFGDLVGQEFSGLHPEKDMVIHTTEEFDLMTRRIVGDRPGRASGVALPIKRDGKLLSRAEMFAAIETAMDDPRTARLLMINSLTRYGDVPCGDEPGGLWDGLLQLLHDIEDRYPDLPILLDCCQTGGRLPPIALDRLGPNVISLFSGSKGWGVGALGVLTTKNRGIIARAKSSEEGLLNDPSTLDLSKITVAATVLHNLQSRHTELDQLGGIEPHWPRERHPKTREERPHKMQQRIAILMQKLTGVALTELHDADMRTTIKRFHGQKPDIAALLDSPRPLIDIYGPSASKSESHAGIMTLRLAGVDVTEAKTLLYASQWDVDALPEKGGLLRIAFHPFHRENDVRLFCETLRETYLELIRRRAAQSA